jgi:dTDP-glucose pyrophosphorylase
VFRGIIPSAGIGSRIQPLAFSKELLPVGSTREDGVERPRVVSEYLVERMVLAGARQICFVISPDKGDIVKYFGAGTCGVDICYVVQPEPAGLCDAIFRALPLVDDDDRVLVGLPDTVWFPADGLSKLGPEPLSFLCFPVERPQLFDAVVSDESGNVVEVRVKHEAPGTPWVWGAFAIEGRVLGAMHALWKVRKPRDVYFGTLVNAWLAAGGHAAALRYGRAYVDTGTVGGYREAMQLLEVAAKLEGPVTTPHLANVVRIADGPLSRRGATGSP